MPTSKDFQRLSYRRATCLPTTPRERASFLGAKASDGKPWMVQWNEWKASQAGRSALDLKICNLNLFPQTYIHIFPIHIFPKTVYRLFTVSYWMGVSFVPSLHLLFVYLVRAGGFRILEGSWKVWESSPAVTEMLEVPVRILRKPPSQNPFNLWKISIAPVLPFRKLDCSHAKQLFCWLQGFPSMLLREG